MKYYIARSLEQFYTGTLKELSTELKVSRQYLHRCITKEKLCKGYSVEVMFSIKPRPKLTKRKKLQNAIALLKRAKLIINEHNVELNNNDEYANINIISDIERFLDDV